MKKLLLLLSLFPLFLVSCVKEETYYAENYQDIVTVYEGKLVNYSGAAFSVAENQTSVLSFPEGTRYFILCDVLNRDLDIRLKDIHQMITLEAEPYNDSEEMPSDPVIFQFNRLSPDWLDMQFSIYKAKGSEYEHRILCRYAKDGIYMKLYLFHDGNNENPCTMDLNALETEKCFYGVNLSNFTFDGISLTYNRLMQNAKGEYGIEQFTATSY